MSYSFSPKEFSSPGTVQLPPTLSKPSQYTPHSTCL